MGKSVLRATALALLVLIAGACVTVEVQPGVGSDAGSETGDAASTTAPTTDYKPETSTSDETHPTPTTDPPETPTPTDSTAPSTTETPDTTATTTTPATTPTTNPPETPDAPETTPTSTDPAAPPTTETLDTTATTTAPATTPTTGVPEAPAATAPLPGDPYEYGPAEGVSLAVVGVDHDDVLNVQDVPFGEIIATLDISNPYESQLKVREAPSGEVIASFDSPTGGIVATGRTRKLPDTVWNEVRVAGLTGWSSAAYLAPPGATHDATARIIDILGETPVADTLIELGLLVGEAVASEEPPSRVVVTTDPIVFEALGEVTVDVLNVGDDSVLGFRLHLFANPAGDWMSENPGPFTLRNVESTVLCYSYRGVTADGLCV